MNAQISSKAASRRGAAARPAERWLINGERVTFADIAKRLGISKEAARLRMQKLRLASGPITWSRLEEIGK